MERGFSMNASDFLLSRGRRVTCGHRRRRADVHLHGELATAVFIRLAGELEASPAAVGGRVGIVARGVYFWIAAYLATLYASACRSRFRRATPAGA